MSTLPAHLLDRRLRTARILVWVGFGVLTAAFFRTQILEHGKYRLQSETNRLRPIVLAAPRGLIVDRRGQFIAENVPGYTVSLLPAPEGQLRAALGKIAPFAHLDSTAIERAVQRYLKAPYQPALVVSDAPFAVVSALEERRLMIPGLVIQTEPKRYYPDSSAVAHLVGNVGEVTEQDLEGGRGRRLRVGSLIGKDGLERAYDDTLRGADGVRSVEVSALGFVVREQGAAPPLRAVAGVTLHTTIDLDLQRYIARIFPAGQRGAVMALDPSTGAVLALYSAPGYDPNAFVGGVSAEYWRGLNENDAHPLLDRAIQARYPPGSTWKLAVAAMALKRGVATLQTRMPIPCRGGLQYYDRYFRCWNEQGHGSLTLEQAIAQSCDVYFYQLGLKLGLTSLLEDANAWGFRVRTGIDLPGEVSSDFPGGTEYFDRLYGPRHWTSAVTLNLAIGQGENSQTLIDMMRLYQMLASDGKARTPYIVAPRPGPVYDLELTPEQLAGLRQAMVNVVEQGTGRGARIATLTIAGKTGTAQNSQGANHGWFIGFGPAEHPAIVVGAIVEFYQHGTAVAPLVAHVIAHYMGADTLAAPSFQFQLPEDSAPRQIQVLPPRVGTDTTAAPTPPPPDSV